MTRYRESRGRIYPVVHPRTIVRDSDDEIVRFSPPLLRQSEDWDDRTVAGKNIGSYFTWLFAAAYHGKPTKNVQGNGKFEPDVERTTLFGDRLTEVKAISWRGSRPFCSVSQFSGYRTQAVERSEEGGTSSVDYALFRYGNRNTHLAGVTNSSIIANLTILGRDLAVVPVNLVYALALNGRSPRSMNHSNHRGREVEFYSVIYGRDISKLHEDPTGTIERLWHGIEEMDIEGISADDFLLNQLIPNRSEFPENIQCWGHPVKSFPVLKFDVRDQAALDIRMREKYEEIERALLGDRIDGVGGIPV